MELIRSIQGWSYVGMIFILTFGLYYYIYYLYKRQKDGTKDYEKYSNMALNDSIDDIPVESINPHKNEKDK
jgi:cytochrome c oxidase cbb3-type subunit 4